MEIPVYILNVTRTGMLHIKIKVILSWTPCGWKADGMLDCRRPGLVSSL